MRQHKAWRWRKLVREESGTEIIEFAVSALVLFPLLFGVMDISRALYTYHFVSYAAQQGARYAAVHGGDWTNICTSATQNACETTQSLTQTYVQSLTTTGIIGSSVTVAMTDIAHQTVTTTTTGCTSSTTDNSNEKGCLVSVQVSYVFNYLPGTLPHGSVTLTATAEEPVIY